MALKNPVYENVDLISSIRKAVVASDGNNRGRCFYDSISIILECLRREDDTCKKAARIIETFACVNQDKKIVMKIERDDYIVPEVICNDSVVEIGWLTGVAKLVCTMLADLGFRMNVTSPKLRLNKQGDFSLIVVS